MFRKQPSLCAHIDHVRFENLRFCAAFVSISVWILSLKRRFVQKRNNLPDCSSIYSLSNQSLQSNGMSIPCKFEDHLKIDFHYWMTFRILLCY